MEALEHQSDSYDVNIQMKKLNHKPQCCKIVSKGNNTRCDGQYQSINGKKTFMHDFLHTGANDLKAIKIHPTSSRQSLQTITKLKW